MASIEQIKASDGSGNANLATVQNSRSPGSSTIIVDTVLGINGDGFMGTMGTPHTFTDPITSETITVISEATAVDFSGHVDGSNLEIDDIAPGYSDLGSEVGDIIIIRPTTQWSDNVAEILEVSHRDDGTLKVATGGSIKDENGNEQLKFVTTASAVNEVSHKNAATGNAPEIQATGGDTNIGLKLVPKGTGRVEVNGAGAPEGASVTTSETTTSTSYADLTTTTDSVTVVIGASGKAIVNLASFMQGSLTNLAAYVSFVVSGANTIAASDENALIFQPYGANSIGRFGTSILLTGLTPGSTTFKMKYKIAGGGATGTFANRRISVIPQG